MSEVQDVKLTPMELIGQGRFGMVFSASCEDDRKIYAVKRLEICEILDGEDSMREVQIHQQLSHNCVNIVQFYVSCESSSQRPAKCFEKNGK